MDLGPFGWVSQPALSFQKSKSKPKGWLPLPALGKNSFYFSWKPIAPQSMLSHYVEVGNFKEITTYQWLLKKRVCFSLLSYLCSFPSRVIVKHERCVARVPPLAQFPSQLPPRRLPSRRPLIPILQSTDEPPAGATLSTTTEVNCRGGCASHPSQGVPIEGASVGAFSWPPL
jgi:hypothetical protein